MRKESKAAKQTLETSTSAEQLEILSDLSVLFAEGNPICESMAEEKTLRDHAAPQVNQAPLCIATPTLQAPLELQSGLIHLLPKFRGLMNEDTYQHLEEFHVVCSSMKSEIVTEEQIMLRAFPFSLDGAAKEWSDSSFEDIGNSLALNTQQFQMRTQQFQNKTRSSIQSLESQVSKLATSMSKLESQGKLPSQTEMNPRQNVGAITLRSGKELEETIRKRDRGQDINAETEQKKTVVMKKLAECVQNEEKSSPLDDVYEGTFSMVFDGEVVKFNAMKRPNDISSVCKVGVINPIVQESLELHQQGKLSNMLSESIDQVCLEMPKDDPNSDEVKEEVVYELEALKPKLGDPTPHYLNSSHTNTLPLVMQESELKLKQLPNYLKYAFFEVQVKEEKLVQMLGEYKEVVAYVKDLSLSTCMQRNPLGVNYDPIQEVQRHLNPTRMEVLKKEFQKLLHTDISSESEWVNQMQVMPNEMGTMVENSEWVDYVGPKPPNNE
ncbi:uncharacterized protein G2W53_004129 [Senna tora]|uniref:Uncharacterized protein n=1 Tax=Senna tora TaxID=362788 RepID=A0A835CHQ3_9FABA|nr:uncharacterized protein G2W53_004129 [Senna tora]